MLGNVIQSQGHLAITRDNNYFEALVSSIVSQQISVKAADSIFRRLRMDTALDPAKIAIMNDDQTRRIGLSGQKANYLRNLASHFLEAPDVYDQLEDYDDDEVIAKLTAVKGIGVWTAQMFLIFTLGRPDVFAPGDRGLQMAIEIIYGLKAKPTEGESLAIAAKWTPYRSTACLHLWQSRHNKPII